MISAAAGALIIQDLLNARSPGARRGAFAPVCWVTPARQHEPNGVVQVVDRVVDEVAGEGFHREPFRRGAG
jgi:hypothetical protein